MGEKCIVTIYCNAEWNKDCHLLCLPVFHTEHGEDRACKSSEQSIRDFDLQYNTGNQLCTFGAQSEHCLLRYNTCNATVYIHKCQNLVCILVKYEDQFMAQGLLRKYEILAWNTIKKTALIPVQWNLR